MVHPLLDFARVAGTASAHLLRSCVAGLFHQRQTSATAEERSSDEQCSASGDALDQCLLILRTRPNTGLTIVACYRVVVSIRRQIVKDSRFDTKKGMELRRVFVQDNSGLFGPGTAPVFSTVS